MYVGDIAGFVKNMGTTISGMAIQYLKNVDFKHRSTLFYHKSNRAVIFVVGFENRLVMGGKFSRVLKEGGAEKLYLADQEKMIHLYR